MCSKNGHRFADRSARGEVDVDGQHGDSRPPSAWAAAVTIGPAIEVRRNLRRFIWVARKTRCSSPENAGNKPPERLQILRRGVRERRVAARHRRVLFAVHLDGPGAPSMRPIFSCQTASPLPDRTASRFPLASRVITRPVRRRKDPGGGTAAGVSLLPDDFPCLIVDRAQETFAREAVIRARPTIRSCSGLKK